MCCRGCRPQPRRVAVCKGKRNRRNYHYYSSDHQRRIEGLPAEKGVPEMVNCSNWREKTVVVGLHREQSEVSSKLLASPLGR
jgi:hypothetical protein